MSLIPNKTQYLFASTGDPKTVIYRGAAVFRGADGYVTPANGVAVTSGDTLTAPCWLVSSGFAELEIHEAPSGFAQDSGDSSAVTGGGSVADATGSVKGKVQLAGDLGGTADSPTVPALTTLTNTLVTLSGQVSTKENQSAKGVANGYASLDSGGLVPSAQLPVGSSTPDATGSVKGIVKLAGDLGGTALLPTVPDAVKAFSARKYGMSPSNTGGVNAVALRAAIAAAQTLGASTGKQQRVVIEPGTYKLDFQQHSLLTSAFVAGTDTVLKVKDTSDFPAAGTLNLTDPFFNNVTAVLRATATVTYTGKTATTFTGCTTTVGGGTTYMPGDSVSTSGVDTGQAIVTIDTGFVEIDGTGGAILDVSESVTYNQNPNGLGYGPRVFLVGSDDATTPTSIRKYLKSNVWPGDQHADVGTAVQPNGYLSGITATGGSATFTKTAHGLANGDLVTLWSFGGGTGLIAGGTYYVVNSATNTFELAFSAGGTSVIPATNVTSGIAGTYAGTFKQGDMALLWSRQSGDNDGGRHNPRAENADVCCPVEFAAELGAAIANGTDLGVYATNSMQNRDLPNPDGAGTATTVKTGVVLGSTDTSVQLTNVLNLTRKNRVLLQNFPQQAGLLMIADGTNTEIVKYEDVNYETGTIYLAGRALYGTSTPASFASGTATSVTPIELALVGSELVAYRAYGTAPNIDIILRGLAGTPAVAHAASEFIFYIPPPGRISWRLPFQGPAPLLVQRRVPPTTKLAVALGSSYTEGTQITVEGQDFSTWPERGVCLIGTEKLTYAYRSHGKLHGVSRGVEGTTVATHAAGVTISADNPGLKLTADLATTGGTSISVNGASVLDPPATGTQAGGEAKYIKIGREIIEIKSGVATSGTASGMIRPSGKTNTASLLATDTTIALSPDASSMPDPVALGVGFCFASIENEVFTYAGISGSNLTGVQRGYMSTATTHASGKTVFCFTTLNASSRAFASTTAESSVSATTNSGAYVAAQPVKQGQGSWAGKTLTAQQVRFRGLTIYSAGTRQLIPRIQGAFGESYGNRRTGIKIGFAKTVQVLNCIIDGTERDGVSIENSIDVKIAHSDFYNINQLGFGNSIDLGGACNDVTIEANTMRHNRHGGICSGASKLNGVPRRVHFVKNHVEDSINSGFEVQAGGEDITIEGNTFVGNNAGTIAINGARALVKNNIIRSNAGSFGIDISNFDRDDGHTTVEGNYLEGCDTGIRFSAQQEGQMLLKRNTVLIKGNTIHNSQTHAIVLQNLATDLSTVKMPGIAVEGNMIRGGQYKTGANGGSARIYAKYIEGALIATNYIHDCGADQDAIWLEQADDCIVSNNIIRFRSATNAAAPAGKSAILVSTGDSNLIMGNRVKGCSAAAPIDVSLATNTTAELNFLDGLPITLVDDKKRAGIAFPVDFSLLSWPYDPSVATSTQTPAQGTVYVFKCPVPKQVTIGSVGVLVNTAGVDGGTLPIANTFFAVYNSAGTRLGVSADQSTNVKTAGFRTGALVVDGGQSLTVGGNPTDFVWGAFMIGQIPTGAGAVVPLVQKPGAQGAAFNLNLATSVLRLATAATGQVTMPSTITPGSLTPVASVWGCIL